MSPDDAYLEKQAKAEEEKLQKKIQALTDSDRKEIYEKGNDNVTDPRVDSLFFLFAGRLSKMNKKILSLLEHFLILSQ